MYYSSINFRHILLLYAKVLQCDTYLLLFFIYSCLWKTQSRWWVTLGSHISSVQSQSSGTDTTLHLPESSISGRLNKPQLIGSWWRTRRPQYIAVWRQPFHFPPVACWVLKSEQCLSPIPRGAPAVWCLDSVVVHWKYPHLKPNNLISVVQKQRKKMLRGI